MRSRTLFLSAVCCALGAVAAACGGDGGPSVRAEPVTSTTSSSTSTSTTTTTTTSPSTTTSSPVPSANTKIVTFGGLRFAVPADWPVYDLTKHSKTCARVDVHAVYLGEQGAAADCPAQLGQPVEAVQVETLDSRSQVAADRATEATTINGLPARVDPSPDLNGALTAVFTDQRVVAILTYGRDRAVVDQILASFAAA